MEPGFILDNTYSERMPASRVEGKPEKRFWTGLTTANRAVMEVTMWRCRSCGYLESYAPG